MDCSDGWKETIELTVSSMPEPVPGYLSTCKQLYFSSRSAAFSNANAGTITVPDGNGMISGSYSGLRGNVVYESTRFGF
jgi:hypothetical protein